MQLFHCKIENLKFSKNTIIKQMMYKLYKSRLALTPLLYARKDEDLKNLQTPSYRKICLYTLSQSSLALQ